LGIEAESRVAGFGSRARDKITFGALEKRRSI
jgi:hypothetical protein